MKRKKNQRNWCFQDDTAVSRSSAEAQMENVAPVFPSSAVNESLMALEHEDGAELPLPALAKDSHTEEK